MSETNTSTVLTTPDATEALVDEQVWKKSMEEISNIDPAKEQWNTRSLPLTRVKKIMKEEEIVMQEGMIEKMQQEGTYGGKRPDFKYFITQDAPLVMAKACELFIRDLSVRAWRHTEDSKRKTLQRPDLHFAVGQSEMFDFLIDFVPRAEAQPTPGEAAAAVAAMTAQANLTGQVGVTADQFSITQPQQQSQQGVPPSYTTSQLQDEENKEEATPDA